MFNIIMIFCAWFLIRGSTKLLPGYGDGQYESASDWWGLLIFQPIETLVSVILGLCGVLLLRNTVKGQLQQWARRGFHTGGQKKGSILLLLLSGCVLFMSISIMPWYVGSIFLLFFLVDSFQYFTRRKKQKRMHQTLRRGTMS